MTALRQLVTLAIFVCATRSPRTIETYVLRVSLFARHFGRSPEVLGPEQVRAYQEHLISQQVSWSTFNQAVCALRFLSQVTLGRPELILYLPFARRPRKLPTVLSPEEVLRLLKAALPGRDRALLQTTYACGSTAGAARLAGGRHRRRRLVHRTSATARSEGSPW